jgi:predicted CXXCH cytochrome family protein
MSSRIDRLASFFSPIQKKFLYLHATLWIELHRLRLHSAKGTSEVNQYATVTILGKGATMFSRRNLTIVSYAFFGILLLLSFFCSYQPESVLIVVEDFYSGGPLIGAEVKMEPGGYVATTDAMGTVTFTDIIPYRNYTAAATVDGYIEGKNGEGRTGFVWVRTGEQTLVTLPMKEAAAIFGQVTDSSEPVAGAMVVLFRPPVVAGMSEDDEYVAATHTDEDGNYTLSPIAEGNYYIAAAADSYFQSSYDEITIGAGEGLTKDFTIAPGVPSLSFTMSANRYYYGNSVIFSLSIPNTEYADKYPAVVDMPAGGEALGQTISGFTPTVPGDYTYAIILTDSAGVGKEELVTVEIVNHPTEAVPSIIPGPSELPLLYNDEVYTNSRGTVGVRPGDKVYLRGWGSDFNLNAPETFDPDAPLFDIYGNKNGDWSQSAFSFAWSLRDGNGEDRTSLLSSPSTQNISFTVPSDAQTGDTFVATLTVTGDDSLAGKPVDISVVVADFAGTSTCSACHIDTSATYQSTKHFTNPSDPTDCEDCHGPGSEHNSTMEPTMISKSHWPGICGRCHDEFAEWQKSRHSDPLAFGHAEISFALMSRCYKCHYAEGFIGAVESGRFSEFEYPMFGTQVPIDTPNISCDMCHDPHEQSPSNPVGIRTGSAATLCGTCHEKKWQNATYNAKGDEIENAHHWGDYSQYQGTGNPHTMEKGCVSCHMAQDIQAKDSNGVRKVGGHALRMRDVGLDGNPGTADDLLNITVCQECHSDIKTFDYNDFMTKIKGKLDTLGSLLKEKNHDFLPPFQPGKCATCHRGGTLPFIHDTADQILDKAYLNYKLILHDRSFGIHNPGYIERLLDDSIDAVNSIAD